MPFNVQNIIDPQASVARIAPVDWYGAVERAARTQQTLAEVDRVHAEADALRMLTPAQQAELTARARLTSAEADALASKQPVEDLRNEAEMKLIGAKLQRLNELAPAELHKRAMAAVDREFYIADRERVLQENAVFDQQILDQVDADLPLIRGIITSAGGDRSQLQQAAQRYDAVRQRLYQLRTPGARETVAQRLEGIEGAQTTVIHRGAPLVVSLGERLRRLLDGVGDDEAWDPELAAQEQAQRAEHQLQYGDNWQTAQAVTRAIAATRQQIDSRRAAAELESVDALQTLAEETLAGQIAGAANQRTREEIMHALLPRDAGEIEEYVNPLRAVRAAINQERMALVQLQQTLRSADEPAVEDTAPGIYGGLPTHEVSFDVVRPAQFPSNLVTGKIRLTNYEGAPDALELEVEHRTIEHLKMVRKNLTALSTDRTLQAEMKIEHAQVLDLLSKTQAKLSDMRVKYHARRALYVWRRLMVEGDVFNRLAPANARAVLDRLGITEHLPANAFAANGQLNIPFLRAVRPTSQAVFLDKADVHREMSQAYDRHFQYLPPDLQAVVANANTKTQQELIGERISRLNELRGLEQGILTDIPGFASPDTSAQRPALPPGVEPVFN